MTTRALVTGANGFVAQWAMRAMVERGWSVTGAGIGPLPPPRVITPAQREQIRWQEMDVTRQTEVATAVAVAEADIILHLAAISHVPDATINPGAAYDVNVVGTVRLLAEVKKQRAAGATGPIVLVVGSAEQYGRHDLTEMPLHEDIAQRPLTPYAASKVAQEVASIQTFRSDGLRILCTRSFNHSGVGQGEHFLLPGLVRRALALRGGEGALAIGNGDTVRDFLHVTDVIQAYLALVDRGTPGEVYNVCSGDGTTVRTLASAVLRRLGLSAAVDSDAQLTRAIDVPALVGDNSKLRRATGWAPLRTRDDIIDDLIHAATR